MYPGGCSRVYTPGCVPGYIPQGVYQAIYPRVYRALSPSPEVYRALSPSPEVYQALYHRQQCVPGSIPPSTVCTGLYSPIPRGVPGSILPSREVYLGILPSTVVYLGILPSTVVYRARTVVYRACTVVYRAYRESRENSAQRGTPPPLGKNEKPLRRNLSSPLRTLKTWVYPRRSLSSSPRLFPFHCWSLFPPAFCSGFNAGL